MIGQYPFAALVGKAIDHYGPWSCSLASSLLFSSGFGLFALEIAKTPDDITVPSQSSFERLALFFFMAGLGTVTSYFSSLFAASKNFPDYIGIASGSSMALFGLSPLFLSLIASNYFTSADGALEVTRFVTFMAILTGVVHVFGAINLRTPQITQVEALDTSDIQDDEESVLEQPSNERSPLIAPNKKSNVQVTVVPVETKQTVMDLLKDPYFWILAFLVMVCLGTVSPSTAHDTEDHLIHIFLTVRNGYLKYRHHCPLPSLRVFFHINTFFRRTILVSLCNSDASPPAFDL